MLALIIINNIIKTRLKLKSIYIRSGSVEIQAKSLSTAGDIKPVATAGKSGKKKPQNGGKVPNQTKAPGAGKPQEDGKEEKKKAPENIRGKKGKLKKMKEKYKDQDDEDRELMMKILQVTTVHLHEIRNK